MLNYTNTYTSPGTYVVVLPYGASVNTVACQGAGGCGGRVRTTAGKYGGGGGGASASPSVFTTYQQFGTFTIFVGTGGTSSGGVGNNGEDSYITYTPIGGSPTEIARAGGGVGVPQETVAGGKGGTVITGVGYTGGNGAAGGSTYSGGGGGGAGLTAGGNAITSTGGTGGKGGGDGGNGRTSNNAGLPGNAPGGGGGGAFNTVGTVTDGGAGANGQAQLNFDYPENVVFNLITDSYIPAATTTTTVAFSATGGAITTIDGGYKYHLFNSSSVLICTGSGLVEVWVVAGGGGGGCGFCTSPGEAHGFGGAGVDVIYDPAYSASGNISVTVGGYGVPADWSQVNGLSGGDSAFGSIYAYGGLGGTDTQAGNNTLYVGGDDVYGSGGGAGASGDGLNGSGSPPSQGGPGSSFQYGPSTYVCSGGGCGNAFSHATGLDGGGAGVDWDDGSGQGDATESGGGGGGATGDPSNLAVVAGVGAAGVVIVRYLI